MNGVLNINKPPGWTSHDVVAKVRGILKEKHIGHLGTLDPLATGVLPLAIGAATRLIEFASYPKEYLTTCLLGKSTDSLDVTGRVLAEKPVEGLSPGKIREEVLNLQKLVEQTPPMVSALKKDGRRLYEWARQGLEVDRKPRPIRIERIEVVGVDLPRVTFRVLCSPGTYVRSLCQTLGEALGTGACMEKLERTQVGPFSLEGALTPEELKNKVKEGRVSDTLIPPDRLVLHLPELKMEGDLLQGLCSGQKLEGLGYPPGLFRVVNGQGALSVIAEVVEGGVLRPRKVFGVEGLH
jgi:tRNA pseudouridine55 synthase